MTAVPNTSSARARASQNDDVVVHAQSLTKLFKDFWMRDRARAVDSISFDIQRGEIFGLLGPNGSGKSTTIKMILGLLKRSSGRLLVFGKTPSDVSIKSRIGYLPEESYLYPFLNARETLEYYAKLFEIDRSTRKKRIDELLDMVGLSAVQHRQVVEYSKGMQRRIGIAQALINDPEFLILDEPTTGLDPIGTRQVKDLIIELGQRGKTILLSSHLLADVEDVVSRMVILYGGKIRQQGTCDDLLEVRSTSTLSVDELDEDTLSELQGVLERRGKSIAGISHPRQKLEELFMGMVEQAKQERLETSGATNDGSTASFLKAKPEEQAQGDGLIEQLVSGPQEEAPEPEAEEAAGAEAASAGPKEPDVLQDLLAPQEPAADASQPAQDQLHSSQDNQLQGDAPGDNQGENQDENQSNVDTSVISSLLSNDADEKKPEGQDGGSR